MRIITMRTKNSGKNYGGAYRRYMELIEGFLSNTYEVHHISPKGFSNITHKNLVHHAIFSPPIKPTLLHYIPQVFIQMVRVGGRHRIDAIVAFSLFDGLLGVLYARFNRKTKVILCDRGSTIDGIMADYQNKAKKLLPLVIRFLECVERLSYQNADLVIFNSGARRDKITKRISLDQAKVKVIHNNANPTWVTKQQQDTTINVDFHQKKVIGFVGNLFASGRDLRTLIMAFKKVKESIGEIILLLVGQGPDRETLSLSVKSLGLERDIIFTGWQDNVLPYMRAMDILVVTALHEGFSNTILEALYCKTVVIGAEVGGIPEALKYDELLFPPKDENALAKRIVDLLSNEEKYSKTLELVKSRRKEFIFDWQSTMIKTIQSITSLKNMAGKDKASDE
ncbi:glycosyltransferase family 4 protein [Chloroflexota bacterium]